MDIKDLSYGITAFIDILGFSDKTKQVKELEDIEKIEKSVIQIQDFLNTNQKMQPIKKILEGPTGCGKTYHAIKEARESGHFIYAVPCRQLVYETAIKYGSQQDAVHTGEVRINGKNNLFCVYESLNSIAVNQFDSLIIDEAHYLTDPDRGKRLSETVNSFERNIFLVTATRKPRKSTTWPQWICPTLTAFLPEGDPSGDKQYRQVGVME